MSDTITLARPYAKAIFEQALANKQLAVWSMALNDLAQLILQADVNDFIHNPASVAAQQSQLLISLLPMSNYGTEKNGIENLIQLLAANKRLVLLPDIYAQYEALRSEQEKTLTVNVVSFTELSSDQEQQLTRSLSERLQRHVTLEIQVDPNLLGGAVIHAGDLVIDGSVRGQLNKLSAGLAASF